MSAGSARSSPHGGRAAGRCRSIPTARPSYRSASRARDSARAASSSPVSRTSTRRSSRAAGPTACPSCHRPRSACWPCSRAARARPTRSSPQWRPTSSNARSKRWRSTPSWRAAGFVDQPLDVTALSRDPAVGEAYAVDPLVWHGAWKRPTIAALGHAQEAVDRGPTFAELPLLWIHGTEDPLVPIAFVRPAIERLRGADFTAHEHAGGRHEVFNEIDRERAIDVLCTFVERVAP